MFKKDRVYILGEPRFNSNWYKVMEQKEEIVFLSSPSFPLADKKEIRLEELLGEPFFLTEKNANYRKAFDRYLASKNILLTPFLEISNTEFILKMIEENKGLSFLPRFAVEESAESGHIRVLDVIDFHASMYRQIFYHKDKWKTREMDEFIRLASLE